MNYQIPINPLDTFWLFYFGQLPKKKARIEGILTFLHWVLGKKFKRYLISRIKAIYIQIRIRSVVGINAMLRCEQIALPEERCSDIFHILPETNTL